MTISKGLLIPLVKNKVELGRGEGMQTRNLNLDRQQGKMKMYYAFMDLERDSDRFNRKGLRNSDSIWYARKTSEQ